MGIHELLARVQPDQAPAVAERYAAFSSRFNGMADARLDAFAQMLHREGILTDAGLRDFLTWRALSVDPSVAATAGPAPGRFHSLLVIGRGGMGEIHLAAETPLNRTVAIKRLHPRHRDNATVLRRFLTEAQVTAQLDHPAIVPIYGLERDPDGTLAYAMKFVRGVTLDAFIAEAARFAAADSHALPSTHTLRARIDAFVPVLNAIAYAHRRGVIHRDLKPENIMVGNFGEVLVMDWGIARLLGDGSPPPAPAAAPASPIVATPPDIDIATVPDEARDTAPGAPPTTDQDSTTSPGLTSVGAIIGTPDFMAPEQAAGEPVDAAADQYALGLLLQELATLAPARKSPTAVGAITLARDGFREPITNTPEPVPRELRAIIAKATAFEPADRYPSVEAMADDVRRFLRDESVLADPDSGLRRVKRWVGHHRGLVLGLGATLGLVAIAVAALLLWRGEVAMAEQRAAAQARENAILAASRLVEAQARAMSENLHDHEMRLAEVVSAARIFLADEAPPSDVVVHRYRGGRRDPASIPASATHSRVYGQVVSLSDADFPAAADFDPLEERAHVDRLARLAPVLRRALLSSGGPDVAALAPSAAERHILDVGVPVRWAYFGSVRGLSVGFPGSWDYEDTSGADGYDHRLTSWYLPATRHDGPQWSSGLDENGLGVVLTLASAVRAADEAFVGVAALDLALDDFIDTFLVVPRLATPNTEFFLLDQALGVLVSSRQRAAVTEPRPIEPASLRTAIGGAAVGHLNLPDGRLALWWSVGRAGLVHVVVGDAAEILAAAMNAPPQ